MGEDEERGIGHDDPGCGYTSLIVVDEGREEREGVEEGVEVGERPRARASKGKCSVHGIRRSCPHVLVDHEHRSLFVVAPVATCTGPGPVLVLVLHSHCPQYRFIDIHCLFTVYTGTDRVQREKKKEQY